MSERLHFEPYGDPARASGVTRFVMAPNALHVQFHDCWVYVYDHRTPGAEHVLQMQSLARQGRRLSTYISQHVQHRYARRYLLPPDASS